MILLAASTTSISNTLSGSPARTLIRRLRPVSFTVPPLLPEPQPILDTKFEVRTETSIRTATSKSIVMQSNNALFAKRNGLLFNNNNTTQKDSNIDNNSELSKSKSLVILRGFCRKAPMESENPHCFRAEALYFYNVTSASCEAFYKGHCARSRNKFNSVQECQDKCIINNSKSSLSSISNPISKSKIIFDRPLGTAATTTTTGTTKRPLQLFKRPRTLFNRRRTAPAAKRLFWDCFFFQFPYIPAFHTYSILMVSGYISGYFQHKFFS